VHGLDVLTAPNAVYGSSAGRESILFTCRDIIVIVVVVGGGGDGGREPRLR
jgi:hypothetical protein